MLTDSISLTDGTVALAYETQTGPYREGANKYRNERFVKESLVDDTPEAFTCSVDRGPVFRYTARVASTEKDATTGKVSTCYAQLTLVGQKGGTSPAALLSALKRIGNFITTSGNPDKIVAGEI